MKAKHIATLSLALAALFAPAQFRPRDRYALTSAQVAHRIAEAFAERGILLSDSQVTLPANVVALDPEPTFDVASIQPLGHLVSDLPGNTSSAVKLTCQSAACVPFYALVTLPKRTGNVEAEKLRMTYASGESLKVEKKIPVEFTIRAGKHATLLLQNQSTHIQMEVVTLENGIAGHSIRVSSLDHKQNYLAEVVNAGLLKGTF